MKYKALGVHVFAGGFTLGVQDVMPVVNQLEVHNLGIQTVEEKWKVPVIRCAAEEWPRIEADMLFGNPRCTGFSNVTGGLGADAHGPWAKQCQDVRELCAYAFGHYPIVIWESVQQAFTTGRELVDLFTEEASTRGYRVAHVFVNARTFGNPQERKRYFFVAHPADKPFNVTVPEVSRYEPCMYDAIWDMRNNECHEWSQRVAKDEYNENSYARLSPIEKECVPMLATGWSMNQLAEYDPGAPQAVLDKWACRTSNMPFSMHCIFRTGWLVACPTLKNSAHRFIHPWHNRPLTVGELAACMGWRGHIPCGPDPVSQIAKGVVPDIGTWLAEQAVKCLDDAWGGEDWSCKYNANTGLFEGGDAKGRPEKIIDVTHYRSYDFDIERFDPEALGHMHRFNYDPATGRTIKDWKAIRDHYNAFHNIR